MVIPTKDETVKSKDDMKLMTFSVEINFLP